MKRRFRESLKYALQGIAACAVSEPHMRLHLLAAAAVVAAGWWLELSCLQWAAISFAIALVLIAEVVNTAIERTVDLIVNDFHPLAGTAKNLGAGAVLLAAFNAAVVGLLVLGPKIWEKLLLLEERFR